MATDDQPRNHAGSDSRSNDSRATSRSLIARARDQQTDAWDRLVELYTPLVYHWCRRMDLAEQDIADVVQDVFQAVATSIGSFRKQAPGDTFRGWLRTITRHKIHDQFRRGVRQPRAIGGTEANVRMSQVPIDPWHDSGEENDEQEGLAHQQLFQRALDLIRGDFQPRTWQAFWMIVVEGMTAAEAAEQLDMRPGTVRVAKSRVLHRLRQELGDVL